MKLFASVILVYLYFFSTAVFAQKNEVKDFEYYCKKSVSLIETDTEKAKISALNALFIAKNDKEKADANYLIAYVLNKKKLYNECIEYYEKAISLNRDKAYVLYVKTSLANNNCEIGKYEKAMNYAKEVLKGTTGENKKYLYNTYGVIGKIYSKINIPDSSKIYFDKAISLIPPGSNLILASFYSEIGDMHRLSNQLDSAITYYNKSLEIYNNQVKKSQYNVVKNLANIAQCYLQKRKFGKAKLFLEKAKNLNISNLNSKIVLLKTYGDLYYQTNEHHKFSKTYHDLDSVLTNHKENLIQRDFNFFINIKDDMYKKMSLMNNKFQENKLKSISESVNRPFKKPFFFLLVGFLSMFAIISKIRSDLKSERVRSGNISALKDLIKDQHFTKINEKEKIIAQKEEEIKRIKEEITRFMLLKLVKLDIDYQREQNIVKELVENEHYEAAKVVEKNFEYDKRFNRIFFKYTETNINFVRKIQLKAEKNEKTATSHDLKFCLLLMAEKDGEFSITSSFISKICGYKNENSYRQAKKNLRKKLAIGPNQLSEFIKELRES